VLLRKTPTREDGKDHHLLQVCGTRPTGMVTQGGPFKLGGEKIGETEERKKQTEGEENKNGVVFVGKERPEEVRSRGKGEGQKKKVDKGGNKREV